MKRLFFVITAVLMTIGCCACVPTEEPDIIDSTALSIMGKTSDLEKPYMKKIFEMYEAQTGTKLQIIEYADEEYEQKAAQKFALGEYPDIFQHFQNAELDAFDVADNFYYLNDEPWIDEVASGALEYCKDTDGNVLGLPFWESSVSGCYYNKTLLGELGYEPVTTQKDFDLLCQNIYNMPGGPVPILWPGKCSWMLQFGLDPVFADDNELLKKLNDDQISYADIPAVHDMVEWICNAYNSGWFGDRKFDFASKGWDDISAPLASGEAVMVFIWDTWFDTDFRSGKYTKNDFALMPVFMNTGPTYEGGNLNMLMVSKSSNKLSTALDFLEFCATPANYNVAFDGISTVSCFKGQTTNIQSNMVIEARNSIAEYERASTASTKISGYNAESMESILLRLLSGEKDMTVDECIKLFDEDRKSRMKRQDQ